MVHKLLEIKQCLKSFRRLNCLITSVCTGNFSTFGIKCVQVINYLAVTCNLAHYNYFTHFFKFVHSISIAPLQVCYYSQALPTQHGYCAGVSHQSATGNSIYSRSHMNGGWLSGRFSALRPEGRRFESHSSRHVGILDKSFTCPRLLRGGKSGSQTHDPPVERYRLNQCATRFCIGGGATEIF